MDWKSFFQNAIEGRGRVIPGLVLISNLLALMPQYIPKVLELGLTGTLLVVVLAYLLGAVSLYASFRSLAKIWDKPHPVSFFTCEQNRIEAEVDQLIANAKKDLIDTKVRVDTLRRTSTIEPICVSCKLLSERIQAVIDAGTQNEDQSVAVAAAHQKLEVAVEKLAQSGWSQIKKYAETARRCSLTIAGARNASRPRQRLLAARITFFRGAFGDDYYGRWDQKVVFDTIKTRLLNSDLDESLARKIDLDEARINSAAGMVFPFLVTSIVTLTWACIGSEFGIAAAFFVVSVFTFIGCFQNLSEFRRLVLVAEPRRIYESYFEKFAGRTPLLEVDPSNNMFSRTFEEQYKDQFRRYSNSLLEVPTEASFRQYSCRVLDLLEAQLFPVWFVSSNREKFLPYYDSDAIPISILQLAGKQSLAEEKLEEWLNPPLDWLVDALKLPIIVEHCEGCGRRLVKDGCHRMLLFALLARGKRGFIRPDQDGSKPVTEVQLVHLIESAKEHPIETHETHDRTRYVLSDVRIDVYEVASNQWKQHSISDMQNVCVCR